MKIAKIVQFKNYLFDFFYLQMKLNVLPFNDNRIINLHKSLHGKCYNNVTLF